MILKKSLPVLVFLFFVAAFTSVAVTEVMLVSLMLLALFVYSKDVISFVKQNKSLFFISFSIFSYLIIHHLFVQKQLSFLVENIKEFKWILFAFFILPLARKRESSQQSYLFIRKFIFIFSIVLVFISILQMLWGVDLIRPEGKHLVPMGILFRATGFFSSPLSLGYSLTLLTAYLLPDMINYKKRKDTINRKTIISLVLILVSLVITFTRGAWLTLIVVSFIQLFLLNKKLSLYFVVALMISIVGLNFNESFSSRIHSLYSLENGSNIGRLVIWKNYIQVFEKKWLFGIGPQKAENEVYKLYSEHQKTEVPYQHAHNNILEFLTSYGAFFLLLYLLFFYYLFLYFYRQKKFTNQKPLLIKLIGLYLVVFFSGLTEATLLDYEFAFGLLASLMFLQLETNHLGQI